MLKYYKPIVFFLVLTVVIYSGVHIFYKIVGAHLDDTPLTAVTQNTSAMNLSRKRPLSEYRVITEKKIFVSAKEAAMISEQDATEGLQPTSLNLILLGTVSSIQGEDYAVIEEEPRKKQDLYKVGDTVQGAAIKRILRQKVVLRVGDTDEVLSMDEKPQGDILQAGGMPLSRRGSRIPLRHSDIEKSMGNIGSLLSQARIQPHFKGGKADGFRLSRIKPNSLFTKMGFRNGDIVHKINNRSIKTTNDMVSLYQNLRSGQEVALEITRRGRKETLRYHIE
jgi:general secretion pathway protein C